MPNHAESQPLFALVSYTPKPLANWLLRLRRSLPVAPASQPHITILPPRPLTIPLSEAKQTLTARLSSWKSFEVELDGVHVFPSSNILYLDVKDGSSTLRRLHAELNTGVLAHEECFEFHPHVTIGGPVASDDLGAILVNASQTWQSSPAPRAFRVEEVALVSISAGKTNKNSRRLWTHNLAVAGVYSLAAGASASTRTF